MDLRTGKPSDKAFVLCDFYNFLDFIDVNNSIRVRGQKHLFHANITIVSSKNALISVDIKERRRALDN